MRIINFFFDDNVGRSSTPKYNPESYLPLQIPGLGLVLTIATLTLIGWLTAGLMGRWLVRMTENLTGQDAGHKQYL